MAKLKKSILWIIAIVVLIALLIGGVAGWFMASSTITTCESNQLRCGNTCFDSCDNGQGGICELNDNVYTFYCLPPF